MSAAAVVLQRDHALHLLAQMLRIRQFEDRCAQLYTEQKIRGFLHLAIGEEATIVGAVRAMRDDDYLISTYRSHGHALCRKTKSENRRSYAAPAPAGPMRNHSRMPRNENCARWSQTSQ